MSWRSWPPTAFVVALCSMLASPGGAGVVPTAPPPEVAAENDAALQPIFGVVIENRDRGTILAVLPGGVERLLGHVRRRAVAAQPIPGDFHAAYYVFPGIVCASGVNAIHVKVGPRALYDPAQPTANPAVNFNLAPAELSERRSTGPAPLLQMIGEFGGFCKNLVNPCAPDEAPDDLPTLTPWIDGKGGAGDTIYTDIPGGTLLFGGPYAPFTGSQVQVSGADGDWVPLEQFGTPDPTRPLPDRIRIRVAEPVSRPARVEIDNVVPGQVRLCYPGQPPRTIAEVLKRVRGTGNFGGGQFAGVGEVRAAHPGVVCLSTSPRGKTGGFQIVPVNHARYMRYPENPKTFQWLLVGSVGSSGACSLPTYTTGYLDRAGQLNFRPPHEGIAPLYSSFLRPANGGTSRIVLSVRPKGASGFIPCPTVTRRTEPGLGDGSPVDGWEAFRLDLPATALEGIADDVADPAASVRLVSDDSPAALGLGRLRGAAAQAARRARRAALHRAFTGRPWRD
ncbi:MAG: hypothetical protein HY815_21730 [Candidatus Riflebacteria bacterium]|nr:hypothetical protein [Candidatus Riflebacteria bacterium]